VARVGFDWSSQNEVWKKFEEEWKEFREARSRRKKEEEMGDLLFTMVNIARKNGINPEDALRRTNAKFRRRFVELEKRVRAKNKKLRDLNLRELDKIWNEVKQKKGR
jgi:uncharacterized protein YabN with tetrapyrrole methylase and pyrophosphatase domain